MLGKPMSKQNILVVDDSAAIRFLIQRELSDAGYEVMLAGNGIEALDILEQAERIPDLITLDIDMPVMDGFEVCSTLRSGAGQLDSKKQQIADIPVFFVSATDSKEDRERGSELKVIDFISKPFAPGDILRAVNNTLNPHSQFLGMTALVVDDSRSIRRTVSNSLARIGLEVVKASNGNEALQLVKSGQYSFDLVITDHLMPGMSGNELCRKLMSFEETRQIPKFFISSTSAKNVILDFFRAGANDYLHKPFTEDELRARIVSHLNVRKYVKQLELLNNTLRHQAEHDGLTGIYNRGFFQETLDRHFAQAQRGGKHLGCVLLDLDYFKNVNDNYGHAFGDLVLIEFANLLMLQTQKTEIAARYGGEEFVLLLPDIDLQECENIAEIIRHSAEIKRYSDGKTKLQVTVSIGISSLQENSPANPDKLLSQADQALYKAKENGRNRVESYVAVGDR